MRQATVGQRLIKVRLVKKVIKRNTKNDYIKIVNAPKKISADVTTLASITKR